MNTSLLYPWFQTPSLPPMMCYRCPELMTFVASSGLHLPANTTSILDVPDRRRPHLRHLWTVVHSPCSPPWFFWAEEDGISFPSGNWAPIPSYGLWVQYYPHPRAVIHKSSGSNTIPCQYSSRRGWALPFPQPRANSTRDNNWFQHGKRSETHCVPKRSENWRGVAGWVCICQNSSLLIRRSSIHGTTRELFFAAQGKADISSRAATDEGTSWDAQWHLHRLFTDRTVWSAWQVET